MEYRILGPLEVVRDGHHLNLGGPRQRAVLAALLVAGGRAVSVDALTEHVWGAHVPPKPLISLRSYLTNLRRVLGETALTRSPIGYHLDTHEAVVDAAAFARLVAAGRQSLQAGDNGAARSALADGLALWRGTPLAEFHHLDFATPERHRLETLRVDATESYFEAALRMGESSSLVEGIECELAANPLREKLWVQLILALYRSGRRADALCAYGRVRDVLDSELGVLPGVELERLAAEVVNESQALQWRSPLESDAAPLPERGSELHGRSAEIRRLNDAVTASAAGRGGVVVVRGESGMGKTAIARHATELAVQAGLATVWAGHAAEQRRPPSWAWAHAVRGLAGQLPAGERHSSAPLPHWWSGAAEDLKAEDAAGSTGFDAVEATALALSELAAARPAVIVLDDLQRADRFTQEVLEHFVSAARCTPLLIVATWQDGGPDGQSARTFERIVGRTDVEVVKLRGLDVTATARLITDASGVTPGDGLVTSIHHRTGGNPFYTRELVRLLADNGRLEDFDAGIDAGADVPEAVSGVIRQRTSSLPQPTRTLLRVAAVIGTEFTATRLATVTATTVDDAVAALLPASSAGLVTPIAAQQNGFRFSHGLVRDAVAAETTGVDREVLHAAIARAYAREAGEAASQDAVDGAHHAREAATALDARTALVLFDRARADAWSRSAYRDVAELDRHALATCARLPSGSERFDREVSLQLQLASVEAVVSGQSSAKVLHDLRYSASAAHEALQSTAAVAMGCLEACGTGRLHDAAVLSDSLVEFFETTGHPIAGAAGFYVRAFIQFMRGALDAAVAAVRDMQSEVPPVDPKTYGALASFEVLAYAVDAHSGALRGDVAAAMTILARGISLATERDDAFGTAVLRVSEIQMSAIVGDPVGVAPRAADVVTLLTELGIEQFLGGARLIHGWALAVGPDCTDTVDDMHAAMALHGQGGRRVFSPLYYALLSDATAAHREIDDARACLTQAEQIAAATGEHVWDAQLSARRLRLVARAVRR
ncbi:hypothetical protein CIW49_08295 [Mycolicibacterium sp. P1-18]|uniref:BTAD domain-containing putative transcriptional regulator n=1 Tax=Mycolicibacterium sp. P1-18 TaxID=2024615 RepID=UPI0011F136E3|nr:BTAD domain-containing putative transcriptional regulator [Mycolicibacterium sp. P1-18]KAA0099592.1 hypothetical protein CIW49_08295 [Mycolicibacterium sp. P1-18]